MAKSKMSVEARQAVSKRMKRFWAQKRREKKLGIIAKPKIKKKRARRVPITNNAAFETVAVDRGFLQSALTDAAATIGEKMAALLKKSTDTPIWKTGDGREIPVTEMEEGHLRNATSYAARKLSMLLTKAVYLEECRKLVDGLSAFLAEADRRGIRL